MMAYDPSTGELEELFRDPGYGKIFAGEGGFYCRRKEGSYGDIAYWVAADGEGTIELGQAEPLGISRTQGETFVTLRDQDPDHAGDLVIVSGM